MLLRARNAVCGIELAYAATRCYAMCGTELVSGANMLLPLCYAPCGTELAFASGSFWRRGSRWTQEAR
eukprot:870468-Rhodomonas_salina.1